LRPRQKQRFRPRTTESRHDHPIAENWLAKAFADHLPPTREAARLLIFDYIETFYNPNRRHSAPGYRSPFQFEKQMFSANKQTLNTNNPN
jgi:transposase InsO family protein